MAKHKSEKLIEALLSSGIIKDKFCPKKAQIIIRKHLTTVHREAVEATIIAKNKKSFNYPQFED